MKKDDLAMVRSILIVMSMIFVIMTLVLEEVHPYEPFTTPTPSQQPDENSLIGYAFIKSEIQSDGTKKNVVDLSIESIGVGQLTLTIPTNMELGNTDIVRLSLTPDSSLINSINVSVPSQNSTKKPQSVQFTDNIDIFPVMVAEIFSAGFEITSNDQSEKVILPDKPTEWIWTIKANDEGIKELVVVISIPVVVDGLKEPTSTTLKNISSEINVRKSLSSRIDDLLPYLVPSLITLVGVLLTIIIKNQRVKKRIEVLKDQISKGESDRQKLEQEIERLKSTPVWQFWRK